MPRCRLPGRWPSAPSANADTTRDGATSTVRSSQLVCPGPELKGLAGLDDLPVDVTVAAAAAPVRALTGLSLPRDAGAFTIAGLAAGSKGVSGTARGVVASTTASDAAARSVRGSQSLAPGLAAAQSWLVDKGDQRGLGMAPCGRPTADAWLLAGGGAPGRQERLVLTNPGDNPVTVDLTLHGAKGPVSSPNGKGVVVPSRGRTTVLLDSISGTETSPAVHVVTHGGSVHAVLNDFWLDGSIAAGSEDAVATAAPSRNQVIAALPYDGKGTLRVAVPGDGEAVVQARALTNTGPKALPGGGVVRVAGGTVRDISIDGLPIGVYGLQVRADVPVVAAAFAPRRPDTDKPGDFAWSSSSEPVLGVAGTPVTRREFGTGILGQAVVITSTGAGANVEVVMTDAAGTASSRRLDLAADTATRVDVGEATSVWVHRLAGKGQVRAGLVAVGRDDTGQVVSAMPLLDAALRTTSVGLLEIPE